MLHTLLYFLALFSLSTAPNWAKLSQMPVEILGFWRLTLAALIVFLWIVFKKTAWPRLKDPKILWMILSGFLFFLHLATYKYAAKNTTISNAMILFASNPVWSSIGAIIFFKETLTKRLVTSYILAILGIYILVQHHVEFSGQSFYGDASSILSAFFYAAFMLTGKKARQYFNNSTYAFFQYFVCAVFFGLTGLMTQKNFIGYSDISWLAVLGLILLLTLLGHLSLTYLVNYMNLSVLTCGKLIEPILASIIAYFVFAEKLQTQSWIAFFLTALSVFILFAPGLFKKSKPT